ncbi:MAG: enolase C-terminal domain-like protein [Acidobacteriaceae bacterium]
MIAKVERRKALLALGQSHASPGTAGGPLAISEISAFAVPSSGGASSYVVLQLRTQSGKVGYGECKDLTAPDLRATREAIVGRPASAYETLRPLVPQNAQGAIDMALLDILGKATNAPVFRVLGGPTRTKARGIVRLAGSSDDELQKDMQKQLAQGFAAFLVPIPVPQARNQGSAYMQAAVARLKAMRAAAPHADFAFEGGDQLTPSDSASLAAAVESIHPLWFDAPCPVSNLSTLRKITDETVVPLGLGRDISSPGTFQDLLRSGMIDLLRLNVVTWGVSGIRRLAAMAETYYVAVSVWHDAGPIASAAALHAAASIPNFFIVQFPSAGAGSATPRDGFFELPKGPGLGVEVDESILKRSQIA